MASNVYPIVGGPSKFDLMISLFDGSSTDRRVVVFKTQCHMDGIAMTINSLEREDGSGESWIFKGWLANAKSAQKVSGYYRTDRRTGNITIKPR